MDFNVIYFGTIFRQLSRAKWRENRRPIRACLTNVSRAHITTMTSRLSYQQQVHDGSNLNAHLIKIYGM